MNGPLSTIELFTVVFLAVCVAGIAREGLHLLLECAIVALTKRGYPKS